MAPMRECPDLGARVERLGELTLKGLDDAIWLCRWLGPGQT
jgi:hypothetical protein